MLFFLYLNAIFLYLYYIDLLYKVDVEIVLVLAFLKAENHFKSTCILYAKKKKKKQAKQRCSVPVLGQSTKNLVGQLKIERVLKV